MPESLDALVYMCRDQLDSLVTEDLLEDVAQGYEILCPNETATHSLRCRVLMVKMANQEHLDRKDLRSVVNTYV